MNSSQPSSDQTGSWRGRFIEAFLFTASGVFLWSLFYPPGDTLFSAILAASLGGSFFGSLAAIFGERMLDVIMNLPW